MVAQALPDNFQRVTPTEVQSDEPAAGWIAVVALVGFGNRVVGIDFGVEVNHHVVGEVDVEVDPGVIVIGLVEGGSGIAGGVGGVPDAVGTDVQAHRHVVQAREEAAVLEVDARRGILLRHHRQRVVGAAGQSLGGVEALDTLGDLDAVDREVGGGEGDQRHHHGWEVGQSQNRQGRCGGWPRSRRGRRDGCPGGQRCTRRPTCGWRVGGEVEVVDGLREGSLAVVQRDTGDAAGRIMNSDELGVRLRYRGVLHPTDDVSGGVVGGHQASRLNVFPIPHPEAHVGLGAIEEDVHWDAGARIRENGIVAGDVRGRLYLSRRLVAVDDGPRCIVALEGDAMGDLVTCPDDS